MNEQKMTASEEAIKNTDELEFALFCIENTAIQLGVAAQRAYQALAEKSNILSTISFQDMIRCTHRARTTS